MSEKYTKHFTMGIWERKKTNNPDLEKPIETFYVASPQNAKPGYFKTIMQALAFVPPNSRIVIDSGIYNEHVVVEKPVEIVAAGDESASPLLTSSGTTLDIQCDCFIEGLDVATTDEASYAVTCGASVRNTLFIERCTMTSLLLQHSAAPKVRECTISSSKRTGVRLIQHAGGEFSDNTIMAHAEFGLKVESDGDLNVVSNMFFHSCAGQIYVSGKTFGEATAPVFKHNRISDVPNAEQGHTKDASKAPPPPPSEDSALGATARLLRRTASLVMPNKNNDNNATVGSLATSLSSTSATLSTTLGNTAGTITAEAVIAAASATGSSGTSVEAWLPPAYNTLGGGNTDQLHAAVVVAHKAQPTFASNTFTESVGCAFLVRQAGGVYRENGVSGCEGWAAVFDGPTNILFDENSIHDNIGGGVWCHNAVAARILKNTFTMNGNVAVYLGGELKPVPSQPPPPPSSSQDMTSEPPKRSKSFSSQPNLSRRRSSAVLVSNKSNDTTPDEVAIEEFYSMACRGNTINKCRGPGLMVSVTAASTATPLVRGVSSSNLTKTPPTATLNVDHHLHNNNNHYSNLPKVTIVVEGNEITYNANSAVYVHSTTHDTSVSISENNIHGGRSHGISFAAGTSGTAESNRVSNNYGHGVVCLEQCHAVVSRNELYGQSGAAVWNAGDAVFSYNTMYNNAGSAQIVVADKSGRGRFEHNLVHDGPMDGVRIMRRASPTFTRNVITSNRRHNVLVCERCDPVFEHNVVARAGQHGVHIDPESHATLVLNKICFNEVAGVFMDMDSTATIRANVFKGARGEGSFLALTGTSATIEKNTFWHSATSHVRIRGSTLAGSMLITSNVFLCALGAAVDVDGAGANGFIGQNVFEDNHTGVLVSNGAAPVVCHNRFERYDSIGVVLDHGAGAACVVQANEFLEGCENSRAVYCRATARGRVAQNVVTQSQVGAHSGFEIEQGFLGCVDNNSILENKFSVGGIVISRDLHPLLYASIGEKAVATSSSSLSSTTPCRIEHNLIAENGPDAAGVVFTSSLACHAVRGIPETLETITASVTEMLVGDASRSGLCPTPPREPKKPQAQTRAAVTNNHDDTSFFGTAVVVSHCVIRGNRVGVAVLRADEAAGRAPSFMFSSSGSMMAHASVSASPGKSSNASSPIRSSKQQFIKAAPKPQSVELPAALLKRTKDWSGTETMTVENCLILDNTSAGVVIGSVNDATGCCSTVADAMTMATAAATRQCLAFKYNFLAHNGATNIRAVAGVASSTSPSLHASSTTFEHCTLIGSDINVLKERGGEALQLHDNIIRGAASCNVRWCLNNYIRLGAASVPEDVPFEGPTLHKGNAISHSVIGVDVVPPPERAASAEEIVRRSELTFEENVIFHHDDANVRVHTLDKSNDTNKTTTTTTTKSTTFASCTRHSCVVTFLKNLLAQSMYGIVVRIHEYGSDVFDQDSSSKELERAPPVALHSLQNHLFGHTIAVRIEEDQDKALPVSVYDKKKEDNTKRHLVIIGECDFVGNASCGIEVRRENADLTSDVPPAPDANIVQDLSRTLIRGNTLRNNIISIRVLSDCPTTLISANTFKKSKEIDVCFEAGSAARVSQNEFIGGAGAPACIVVRVNAAPSLVENTFTGCLSPGVAVLSGASPVIENNTFSQCEGTSAMLVEGEGADPRALHNHFYTNNIGIVTRSGATGSFECNDFQDNKNCGIRVSTNATPKLKKCFFRMQKTGVEVMTGGQATLLECMFEHITSSGNRHGSASKHSKLSLTAAMAVIEGEEGVTTTMTTMTSPNLHHLGSAVSVTDADSLARVDHCNFNHCGHAITVNNLSNADVTECVFLKNDVGIKVHNSASAVVDTSYFYKSKTHAIVVRSATAEVLKNIFLSNLLTAISVSHGVDTSPNIEENAFYNNVQGIHVTDDAAGTVKNNVFAGNQIAVLLDANANPSVDTNVFHSNKESAIKCAFGAAGKFSNNLLFSNLQEALLASGDDVTSVFDGCCMIANEGSGLVCEKNARPVLNKCIFAANTANGIVSRLGGNPQINACWISHHHGVPAVLCHKQGKGTFDGCFFNKNFTAVEVHGAGTAPKVSGCVMYQNEDHAVVLREHSAGDIVGNLMMGARRSVVLMCKGTTANVERNNIRGWLPGLLWDHATALQDNSVSSVSGETTYANVCGIQIVAGASGEVVKNNILAVRYGVDVQGAVTGTTTVLRENNICKCQRGVVAVGGDPVPSSPAPTPKKHLFRLTAGRACLEYLQPLSSRDVPGCVPERQQHFRMYHKRFYQQQCECAHDD
eukprot:PhM_4_TR18724/c1_g1_i2/m.73289